MITRRAGIWVAELPYAAKDELKAAGWRYHSGPLDCRQRDCPACKASVVKHWWTDKPSHVRAMNSALLDTSAAEALRQHDETVRASAAAEADLDVPAPDGLSYLPFQRAGIAYLRDHRRVILGDEMGLGKTVQAIGLMNLEDIATALVVCPAQLRINWVRELERWLVEPRNIHLVCTDDPPPPDAEVVVINYERLIRPVMHEQLMGWIWDVLIVDEAHNLKTPEARRTVAVMGREAKPKKKIEAAPGVLHRSRSAMFLTGTAMLNRPIELYTLLRAVDPVKWSDKHAYGKRYCGGRQKRIGWDKEKGVEKVAWDFSGASHLGELQDVMRGTCFVRRLKSDVLTELPPKRREIIVLPPDKAVRAVTSEAKAWAKTYGVKWSGLQRSLNLAEKSGDGEAYANVVAKMEACLELAFDKLSTERRLVAEAKAPAVIDHLQKLLEVDEIPKVVCFAHHHEVLDQLAQPFGGAVVSLDGRDTPKVRQEAIDAFQGDPAVKLMVAGIRAAGEGLTLTAASHMVFAELDWTPARVVQAEDRCHRIGQKDSVLVQHLVFDKSIDALVLQLLVKKQKIADKLLNMPG